MRISDIAEIVPVWGLTEDAWRELRKPHLGGSDIGAAAGWSRYTSKIQLWAEKSGLVEGFAGNEATDWGNALEPVVAEMYAKQENVALVVWPVLLISKAHPFAAANVDRWIVESSEQFPAGEVTIWESEEEPPGVLALLECKTGAIASPGKPQEWFQDGESIPLGYEAQGMWYLAISGLERAEYAALIGTHGLLTRTLHRDEDTIEFLFGVAREFWNYVEDGIQPEVDGSDSTEETLKVLYPRHSPGKVYQGNEAFQALWDDYKAAKDAYGEAEANRKKARAALAALLGDSEEAYIGETPICTFRASKDVERLDVEALKREQPGIVKQYTRLTPGARQIRECK